MMLKIFKDNKNYEFNYEGIKIFQNKNTNKLYKELFKDASLNINGINIKNEEIIYISELSKIDEFINFSKKSILMSLILEKNKDNTILNNEVIKNIVNEINNEINYDLISQTEGDIIKIITNLFDLTNIEYINENNFKVLLDFFLNDKKVIIIDNCSWTQLDFIKQYINKFNFILLVNDFRNLINNLEYLELLVLESYVEILDLDILISYLEKEINQYVDEEIIINFLKKEKTYLNFQIENIINKI